MKDTKATSERRHKRVHKFLVKNFPGCKVEYDGVEGVDHRITFNGKVTYLETKTCDKFIRGDVRFSDDEKTILLQDFRLGRLNFDQRIVFPYEPLSQHSSLVENDGWYIFVIGTATSTLMIGSSARNIDKHIKGCWRQTRIEWDKILSLCYPKKVWLKYLKMKVYGIEK